MSSVSRLPLPASRPLRLSLCLIVFAALAGAGLLGAGAKPPRIRIARAQYRMGTVLEIDAVGPARERLESAISRAFGEVARTESRLSNWRADSELSRANRAASVAPFSLSAETFWSLDRALRLARETDGAFDPTVGGVTRALGLMGGSPDPERAIRARSGIGWRRVLLDSRSRTLSFSWRETSLDSGAFGKGEALDRAVAALRAGGVVAARLNFGGQIALLGAGSREARRMGFDRVVVAAPDGAGAPACGFFAIGGSVSTSGDAEKPGHLIDPKTGEAAAFHGSVTVIADTALRADALSTALFVMGPREGLAFADRRGIAALFIVRKGETLSIVPSRAFPHLSSRSH